MTILKPRQIWTLYGLQPCLLLQKDDLSDPLTWEVLLLNSGEVDVASDVGQDTDNELVSTPEEWK